MNRLVARAVRGAHAVRNAFSHQDPKIAVLTDFGYDEAVYAVKSAIAFVNNRAKIADICHSVPLGNILVGAWRLRRTVTLSTESEGTIYVAVVDPGVGTERKNIVIRTESGKYLVGPDNGLLSLAAIAEGIDRVVEIQNNALTLLRFAASSTFHGKDVFGPVAAHIASGIDINEFGPSVDPKLLKTIKLEREVTLDKRVGPMVDIDGFGSVRTYIANHLPEGSIGKIVEFVVSTAERDICLQARLARTFGECKTPGEPVLILSSTGSLDLAVNLGSASKKFGIGYSDIGLDEYLHPTSRISLTLPQ